MTHQLQLHTRAHLLQERQKRTLQEIHRRGALVVGASGDTNLAGCCGHHQGRQHGLQHERAAAGRPDGELVCTRLHFARPEGEFSGSHLIARHGGITDLRRRFDGGQMLAHQTRPFTLGPDVRDPERDAQAQGERKRRAQDLASALAFGSIARDHAHPFTQTTCFNVWTISTRSRCACITASMSL
jgi:hypothetical protein